MTITNLDAFYININDGLINQDLRKYTIEFGAIDGNILPIYWDKRPVSKGRATYDLDYTATTVEGATPTSAANLQTLIEELLSQTSGSNIVRNITSVSTPYNVLTTDDLIICDGTFDVGLFTAVGNEGKTLDIKNKGTGTVTAVADGSEEIDGENNISLIQYEELTLVSDGANWQVI
jgi:hypothetical protein